MKTKRAAEVRTFTVSMTEKLASGELLTGTPTVTEVGSSDLTISGEALNTEETVIAGGLSLVSEAVVFTVSGGVAGRTYRIQITVGTDADTPQTLIQEMQLKVN